MQYRLIDCLFTKSTKHHTLNDGFVRLTNCIIKAENKRLFAQTDKVKFPRENIHNEIVFNLYS